MILVKNTPHAPGRLFVGVAPRKHVREGSDVRSETKIFNLETHEFGSNPPFKKSVPPFAFHSLLSSGNRIFLSRYFWQELELKKSKFENLELFIFF
jgi:hypothetical protein